MDLGAGIRRALARVTGAALVDEKTVKEMAKELQRAMISSDVNVRLVFELTKRIEERALREKPVSGFGAREHVVKVVYEELQKMLGEKFEPRLGKQKIMMVGLFGQGKTTSIAKIAKFYKTKGLRTGVIAADIHRPAAAEQLQTLAAQAGCAFYGAPKGAAADKIAEQGVKALSGEDVIILDSAGRSAFDETLVKELKAMNAAFGPDAKYLVVSADLGQVAGKQAEEFHKAVGIDGVIITKMDGSGKGGGALSSVAATGAKVAFIGTGEKLDALELFDPEKFVARLCGFPDLETLVAKAKSAGEEEKLKEALEEGKLDYEVFLSQMKAMKKMGPLKGVLQMMGAYDLPEEMVGKSEEKMKKFEAIVHSMTKDERKDPELMRNRARQERVAKGAGAKLEDVRELVSSFDKVEKMMKGIGRNRGLMKRFEKMFGGMKLG
ncbi:MAG: signal recognition particle receptor subunit alpha [Candidatus Micrarchaeota archaeon]|nr:signal recognition particle receptor subunit alpha [Candidatus Micrarchaeota archaeon]